MNRPNVAKIVSGIRTFSSKHSPEILTAIGITGMAGAIVSVGKATPKALILLEYAREEKQDDLTKAEVVKACWKCYIPAVLTFTFSAGCLIGANSVNAKRNAALATAYKLSETAFAEYKEKVIETIGEKKEKEVRNKVAKDRIEKNPVNNSEVIITDRGNTLCYDHISGRYFNSDIDKIKKAENELNRKLLNEMYISLNDFYDSLGLESTRLGDELGWNYNGNLIELDLSSQIASDGRPAIVIDYNIAPIREYYKLA